MAVHRWGRATKDQIMFKPLFDTTVAGWSGQFGLDARNNDAMRLFAQRQLAKRLLCHHVVSAVQACNQAAAWGGLGPRAMDPVKQGERLKIQLTARLWSVMGAARGRIAGLSVLDQSGQLVGMARSGRSGATHHAHISLSLADPHSGTVIGAVVFELDAAQF
jgi:hypothetical protein